MSFGIFNLPLYCRRWKPGVSRLPIRWLSVERDTGVVLASHPGVKAPRPPHAGVVVVAAMVPR